MRRTTPSPGHSSPYDGGEAATTAGRTQQSEKARIVNLMTIVFSKDDATRVLFIQQSPGKNSEGSQAEIQNERTLSLDRKSTRLNSSHSQISYAVFCLKKKNIQ